MKIEKATYFWNQAFRTKRNKKENKTYLYFVWLGMMGRAKVLNQSSSYIFVPNEGLKK